MRTKITEILIKTAKETGHSNEEVAMVMNHCFNSIRNFILHPTKAGLRIPYIGLLRTKIRLLNFHIKNYALPRYKSGKMSKTQFLEYWKLRELTRDDERRRKLKERTESKYYAAWRQSFDSIKGNTGPYED